MILKKINAACSICIFLLATTTMNAQRVAISATASVPDASAMLDVKSTTLGMLIPRMSTTQRTAIASPAQGLMVYDNVTNTFWFHNGLAWTELTAGSTTNYWSVSGGNIFKNNSGNVGIGTNAPAASLHIKKDGEAVRLEGALPSIGFYNNSGVYKGFVWQGPGDNISLGTSVGNSSGRLEFYNNGGLNMSLTNSGIMELNGSTPYFRINENGARLGELRGTGNNLEISARKSQSGAEGNLLLQLDESSIFGTTYAGNVGIKTETPVNILQIGDAPGFIGNQLAIGNGTKGMSFFQNATTSHWYSSTNFALMPAGAGSGNVGIGTTNPTQKLSVNGVILSKEIIVETGWADYVFHNDYKLLPLNEVEDFIKSNNHLPNIPSSKEIEEQGLHVGDIQKRMMEKIEELTLYLIEAGKKISALEQQVQSANRK